MQSIYRSPPLRLGATRVAFQRADIVLEGLEQAGPSYEARVFLNNADANQRTDRTPEMGYAGTIHVYGTGLATPGRTTGQSASALPMTRSLIATEAVRAALANSLVLTVTVVASSYGSLEPAELNISQVDIVLDPAGR